MVLTDKQRRFVDAKARGASNKNAAEAAGCKGPSASATASRWMKNPEIQEAIEALKSGAHVNSPATGGHSADDQPAGPDDGKDGGEFLDCLPVTEDPLVWLLALMNEPRAKVFDRRNAAQTAVPYVHGKKGDMGKKEQKAEAAKQAGKGKFAQGKPPLSVVKG